jgi:excisionase family DNA binding protein
MDLLTVRETADLLRVSPVTVRRYIASRRLPAFRVGRAVRIPREDVERLPKAIENKPNRSKRGPKRSGIFTMEDSLWNIVGIGRSDGSTDVSENKYKYLAEAYLDTHEDSDGSKSP